MRLADVVGHEPAKTRLARTSRTYGPCPVPRAPTGTDTPCDSHLKAMLVHHQVIVPVTDGELDLGPWQQIFYCEFDGRRAKRLVIKVLGE